MNPYAFTDLVHPTVAVDYRLLESSPNGAVSDYSMSRAIFRAVCVVENFLQRR